MRLRFTLPLLLMGQPVAAQFAPHAGVDRIFAEYDKPSSPGCAVGAAQKGQFVYQRGYGQANLDYDIPNSPGMVYYVGSVSKQFTAASVALLSLQGKISLDDDIRKYFPELPDYGAPIRIRHLVYHSSGVRDIYALMSLRGDRLEDVFPDSAALSLITRQKGLGFRTGDAYSYSNSGYFLLAQLVKRVTGQSLREYADEQIFQPLGMTRTHFHDDPGHVMKERAMSYERDGKGGYRISYIQNFDKIGAGGLYTTLDDLRKWDENYYSHKVGGPALQAIIHTRAILNKGDTLTYAFGNTITTARGLPTVEHSGSLMGYKAYLLRFPTEHFSVIVTCNLGAIDPGPLAHAVAAQFIGDRMQPAAVQAGSPAAANRPNGAPALSNQTTITGALAGDYYSEDLGVTYRVRTASDGKITVAGPRSAPVVLVETSADNFRMGSTLVRFDRPAGAMVLTVGRIGEMRMVRR